MKLKIVPVGVIDPEVLEVLKQGIEDVLPAEVCLGNALDSPLYAYDGQRNQYSAEEILNVLAESGFEDEPEYLLGITDHDLYIPELTFVFGIAFEKMALVSVTRLRQEFYNHKPDKDLFAKRILTEAVHEISHLYGMRHCFNPGCVMFFSHSVADTDRKGFEFCDKCAETMSRLSKPLDPIDESDPRLGFSLNVGL